MTTAMYDYLLRDYAGKAVGIAEGWEMSPDGKSYTLYIRKGVKFHNGEELTAHDVAFTLEEASTPEAEEADIRDQLESTEVIDDYTMRVFLKEVQPYFWTYLAFLPGDTGGIVIPEDYITENGWEYFKRQPIGTGPFKFVSYSPGDSVKYEAIDSHFRQTASFKNLTLLLVPEETTRVAMLKTGGADAVGIGTDSVPVVEEAGMSTVILLPVQSIIQYYGVYEDRGKDMPVADIRVRKALSLAIDRDEINSSMLYGYLQPPMPPGTHETQGELDVPYWREAAAEVYRYDPEEAMRLLEEAGYPEAFEDPTIELWPITGIVEGAYFTRLALVVQDYWQKVGITSEIVPTDDAAYGPLRMETRDDETCDDELVGVAVTEVASWKPMPTRSFRTIFGDEGSCNAASASAGKNRELADLIKSSLAEPDTAKRFEMHARATRMGFDMHIVTVIGAMPGFAAFGPRLDLESPPADFQSILQFAEYFKHK
ncbi:ABC transporter substrate-binding protein [Chloroflexota bacterium]